MIGSAERVTAVSTNRNMREPNKPAGLVNNQRCIKERPLEHNDPHNTLSLALSLHRHSDDPSLLSDTSPRVDFIASFGSPV